ncbi:MAG: hypothetical protein HZB42_09085 [Sphingobacteriales bacterium]|nr:hypothetical protein [Sphingobacteriales bacterium]
MENRFDNRDFEQFVKQNADQYRMFPSEKVWKNIHFSLHTRRKWYGIGLASLLLTVATVTWVMLSPVKKNTTIASKSGSTFVAENNTADSKKKIFITATQPAGNKNRFISNAENLQSRVFPDAILNIPESNVGDIAIKAVEKINNENAVPGIAMPALNYKTNPIAVKQPSISKKVLPPAAPEFKNDIVVIPDIKKDDPGKISSSVIENKKDIYPLTIESVVNSYMHQKPGKKLSWEVYFSPNITYRKLAENKAFINSAQASNNQLNYYTAIADINSLVTHKPDLGIQLGFNAGYPLTRSIKILAGLQFNVSKYDILAYTYSSEVATIALNTGTGLNSVSTFTNYRNFDGNNAGWLSNLYFSASVPVGVELKLNNSPKTQIGVAATIQPTYVLGDRVYLLSTDYKNYVEVPSLTRRWNLSGGFEAFARYNTGKIQWKIGPQFRYQMLSSFKQSYPVREHLYDFGVKLGVTLKNP